MTQECFIEKRSHSRFDVSEKVIGVSNVGGAFHVVDISEGGFAAKYYDRSIIKGSKCVTSIYIPAREIYIHSMPIEFQWMKNCSITALNPLFAQQAGVQFEELDEEQIEKLHLILKTFTADAYTAGKAH